MNDPSTQEQLLRAKLAQTPVPDWREGWKKLQPNLNEVNYFPYVFLSKIKKLSAAAVVLLLLSYFTWQLWNRQPAEHHKETNVTLTGNSGTGLLPKSIKIVQSDTIHSTKIIPIVPKSIVTESSHQIFSRSSLPLLSRPASTIRTQVITPLKTITSLNSSVPLNQLPGHFQLEKSGSISLNIPAAVSNIRKPLPKIRLDVSLNANSGTVFGSPEDNFSLVLKGTPIDIYPAVHITKMLTERISLQAGLAVLSPVEVRREALNVKISDPVRAMAMNLSRSEDSIRLDRLYYADIPVTIQYYLTKNLSIGSGLQISFLEKMIGEKQQLDYNYSGTLAATTPPVSHPENLNHTQSISGAVKPIDLRWVAGIRYQFGKHWIASIQYQYGLTDISNNKIFMDNAINKNNLVKAELGFLIK